MTVIKNEKSNTWEVRTYFKNLQGDRKQKTKRGFKTRREAVAWEAAFKTEEHCDLNMTFESYYRIYERDIKPTLKLNTWKTKQAIVEKKILPFIGNRKIDSLTPADIRAWQVEVMNLTKKNGEPLSQDYLRTIHCQLSAMLNHAVRFYGLKRNVANVAGSMGGESHDEIKFWTQTEYEKFAEAVADKPLSYFAFEILYWCGLRLGEMQALTPEDIDFERNTIRINKSYQRINRKDVITPPKTPKSNRTVYMPKSLGTELKCFLETLYGLKTTDRIFTVSKSYKQLTKRSWSVSMDIRIQRLNWVIRGWINYFRIGKMKRNMTKIDEHLRTRMRIVIWKQWKTSRKRMWGLRKLGAPEWMARQSVGFADHYQAVAKTTGLHLISKQILAKRGLVSCLDYYLN